MEDNAKQCRWKADNKQKYLSSLDNKATAAQVLTLKYLEKKKYGKFDENKDLNFTIVFYIWISSDHSAVHALGRLLILAY